jgi:arsenate reductase
MDNDKIRVLFLCVHNSARSQMAEAFLKKYGGKRFSVHSAGLEPGRLNPIVVEAMSEEDIDISRNRVKGVKEFLDRGVAFDYVVTVCDESNAERCPVFPGDVERLHWGFDDPSGFTGSHLEKLDKTRAVRDKIEDKILDWLRNFDN